MASAEKDFLPIPPPPTNYKDDPHTVLSQTEQKMYDEVLAHLTRTSPVYEIPNIEKGELSEDEKFWLSRECILRYLRASKWKVSAAIQRLESTLKWRREYGIYDVVSAQHVEPEAVTGKEILYGYDVTGKPGFYMIPSRQNTDEPTRQIQFAVWMLERCIDLMEPGVENLALLINFGDRGKNPSFSTSMAVLNILQNHYPERLGLALIINVPFFVNAFFKLIMPFVDPVTTKKVKFNPKIFEEGFFKKDMVMKEWGGSHNFEYVHDKYWPDLVSTCEKRVKMWRENWGKLGSKVGISEWDYKKGNTNASTTVQEKKVEEVNKAEKEGQKVEPAVVSLAAPEADPSIPAQTLDNKEHHKHEHHTGPADVPSASQPVAGGHSVIAVSGAGAVAGGAGGGGTTDNDAGSGPGGDAGADGGSGGDAGGGDGGGE